MSFSATLAEISDVLGSKPVMSGDVWQNIQALGISTDTRHLNPGAVFLALRGENFDGHDFIPAAVQKGAVLVIVERQLAINVPQLVVADSLKAYQDLAHWWRKQFSIPVIAVTGSFGKTTTKELIAGVLQTHGKVLKTQANFNNEIGVPKTLLELSKHHDFAVIEMAMRGLGQIAELTAIAEPTIGVITNVGSAHIGLLGSEEAIAEAKCELLATMPATSTAILNYDNQLLITTANKVWQGKTITYGLDGGDIQGTVVGNTMQVEGIDLSLPLTGRHNAYNYLAALAVARELGIPWQEKPVDIEMPEGRAKRYQLAGDVVILDESYNAGLESMKAALHLLAETPAKRHIAVLGTMRELGERSAEFHYQIGTTVRDLNLDALLILADETEAEAMAQGAEGVSLVETFINTNQEAKSLLLNRLNELISPGDCVLFKASHAVALDKIIEQFKAEYQV